MTKYEKRLQELEKRIQADSGIFILYHDSKTGEILNRETLKAAEKVRDPQIVHADAEGMKL